eukprot:TRINITY_DN268_c2_g1_i1.p1 TRINITY_DN268_c2_g1~~TRINITY_DN268_c2_g1_i1.p1  ORF type:complete len:730 (+),score=132.00 TRINITY_DN268_c2_g1_i1:112-2301(+)
MSLTKLEYNRIDLIAMAAISRGCMRVIPRTEAGKAKRQKVVVADMSGALNCFTVDPKANDVKQVFKAASLNGKGFSDIDLNKDKIFTAAGDCLRAFSRKGKEFFKVETNLTEPIGNIAVATPWVWTAGDYVVACFEEGNEVAYLNSPDHVNDLIMCAVKSDKKAEAVIACQDRALRVIQGTDVVATESCEGAVVSIQNLTLPAATKKQTDSNELLYGTANGFLGSKKISGHGFSPSWSLPGNAQGGVSALQTADVSGDGLPEILLGRDDGIFQIFGFEPGLQGSPPSLLFQTTVSESVQAVDSGNVLQTATEDVIICTYTGKVIGYTTDTSSDDMPVRLPGKAPPAGNKKGTQEKKKKLLALQEEIEKMKAKVQQKKDEYSKCSGNAIAVTATHNVKDKFVLDPSAAWFLTLEMDAPIDMVILKSDVDIELLDTDSNPCIVSTSDPEGAGKVLASYRCTESTSRIEIKVRTVEGQHGTLEAYIIPFLTPKTCQMTSYSIKPLSLHQRLNDAPALPNCCNLMKVDGSFTVTEMHSWIAQCLPEVPTLLQSESATFYFKSAFQNTILRCSYRGNEAVFVSDNITTLSVLWDFISRLATSKKIKLSVSFDNTNLDESCKRVLTLMHSKLQYQLSLSDRITMMEALKEIEIQEQDVSFLSREYQQVLKNVSTLEKEFAMQPRRLEFLCSIVKKLFLDKHKAKGQNPTHKIPLLMQKLQEDYSLDSLVNFFATG